MKKVHVLWSLFAVLLLAANVNAIDFTNIANQAKEEAEKKAKEEAAKKLTLTAEDAIKEAYETPQPQYQSPPQQKQYKIVAATENEVLVYPAQQVQYKCECNCGNKADNFTAGERWGTWALNTLVPGLGSATIMNDWVGMSIQLALTGLGIVSIVALGETEESYGGGSYCYDYDYNRDYCRSYINDNNSYTKTSSTGFIPIGIGLLGVNFIFNIARSNSYNKPSSSHPNRYSSTERGGFNLSVLNNRNGEAMPYLMYSKIF